MNLPPRPPPPPPQDGDPVIRQFRPQGDQWELNDNSIKCVDTKTGETILHNYYKKMSATPLAVYRYLIETKGCDINARDDDNDTPIHLALRHFDPNDGGDIAVLIYLLTQEDVNGNIKSKSNFTLLHTACKNINTLPLDIFKALIETQSCDVNALDNSKNTPIHNALSHFDPDDGGDITVLNYLLNQKKINGNLKGRDGETLLHTACFNVNTLPLDAFKALIEILCCDVNAQDNYHDTPLHNAIRYADHNDGSTPLLTYLINQKGVDANIKGRNGCTLLHLACKNINFLPIDIFKVLVETHGADVDVHENNEDTPIHNAFANFNANRGGNITVLNYLLSQNGLDGNIRGQYRYTLLHMACYKINTLPLGTFLYLVETLGCDVNVQDKFKNTPIHLALRHFEPNDGGDISVLHYLLGQQGVNGNIKGEYGSTLLHLACSNINHLPLDIFRALIETHGCDVNVEDNYNNTPIQIALQHSKSNGGNFTVLMYLLGNKNININTKDEYGNTLLHYASDKINDLPLDVFKFLIETLGCDVNVQNNAMNTPIHNTLRRFDPNDGGDITVLTYLLSQNDVNFNIKGESDHTLLHLACINNLSGSRDSTELNSKFDTILCQIVEMIVERCIEQVLDDTTF
jgi:ankyrin repeat protein